MPFLMFPEHSPSGFSVPERTQKVLGKDHHTFYTTVQDTARSTLGVLIQEYPDNYKDTPEAIYKPGAVVEALSQEEQLLLTTNTEQEILELLNNTECWKLSRSETINNYGLPTYAVLRDGVKVTDRRDPQGFRQFKEQVFKLERAIKLLQFQQEQGLPLTPEFQTMLEHLAQDELLQQTGVEPDVYIDTIRMYARNLVTINSTSFGEAHIPEPEETMEEFLEKIQSLVPNTSK